MSDRSHERRVLIIRHDYGSDPGHVGRRLRERGFRPTAVTVVPGGPDAAPDIPFDFPGPEGWDLIVSLGAPWSVYDGSTVGRWIGGELELLRAAHRRGVPVLGICFGAQALATALGGAAERAPRPEIGWSGVRVTEEGRGLIGPGPWFQWHLDRCVLPPGAVELAYNDTGPQAFRVGRSLGVQFHPELTTDVLRLWIDSGGKELCEENGIDPDALLADTAATVQEAEERAFALVDAYLDRVATDVVATVSPEGKDSAWHITSPGAGCSPPEEDWH